MGRHSAPADEDEATTAAPLATVEAEADSETVGRHARPAPSRKRGPRKPPVSSRPPSAGAAASTGPVARIPAEVPAELPAERTLAITAVDAELAAEVDAADAPVLDAPAAESLELIRPGEAFRPTPTDDEGEARRPRPTNEADEADEDQPGVSVDEPAPGEQTAATSGASPSDLDLLRSDPALLARCIAAIATPFVIYLIVMFVVGGHGRQWLIWIWIPTIAAGVLLGAFLDAAHKRLRGNPREKTEVSGS